MSEHNVRDGRVVILAGSPADLAHVSQIREALERFGIPSETRIASAHKSPARLLSLVQQWNAEAIPTVFITVAGRSNALSGMLDAATPFPVIACPPPSEQWAQIDIWSSLRMPSGVAPAVVLDPANAALCAAKILGLADAPLKVRISEFQRQNAEKLEAEDRKLILDEGRKQ